jgi:hypothetical protein
LTGRYVDPSSLFELAEGVLEIAPLSRPKQFDF